MKLLVQGHTAGIEWRARYAPGSLLVSLGFTTVAYDLCVTLGMHLVRKIVHPFSGAMLGTGDENPLGKPERVWLILTEGSRDRGAGAAPMLCELRGRAFGRLWLGERKGSPGACPQDAWPLSMVPSEGQEEPEVRNGGVVSSLRVSAASP